jgi:16S rRNA (guanine966-N2)-methyltransferase
VSKPTRKQSRGGGSVRIIAGQWRGSRLPVADLPGLRPSGDRCRETLFNWLQLFIRNADCVDLFAGSGALGMEAASRGARRVVLVEKALLAAKYLRENAERLDAGQVEVVAGDALEWLGGMEPSSIDIAFIDPPFGFGLEIQALELLHRRDGMRPGGHVYVETAKSASVPLPGPEWQMVREKVLGEVRMVLMKKSG